PPGRRRQCRWRSSPTRTTSCRPRRWPGHWRWPPGGCCGLPGSRHGICVSDRPAEPAEEGETDGLRGGVPDDTDRHGSGGHPRFRPALVAKQAAEVDVLSSGRLVLAVGTGWNYVEYESLGGRDPDAFPMDTMIDYSLGPPVW